jgi:hypothetical protein
MGRRQSHHRHSDCGESIRRHYQPVGTNEPRDVTGPTSQFAASSSHPPISLHVHIAVCPLNSEWRGRRYRGNRRGGSQTSLHRPPDKSSSRICLTSLAGARTASKDRRRWSQARSQPEGRTCLQNCLPHQSSMSFGPTPDKSSGLPDIPRSPGRIPGARALPTVSKTVAFDCSAILRPHATGVCEHRGVRARRLPPTSRHRDSVARRGQLGNDARMRRRRIHSR